ncbi:MAG: cyclic nucleotide-binding domain-containing protein [Planctomycetes bacterium]|jgi:CRP-like cAMP-binding protein|nr:cyclic nucleotide-binding domain-containing protein [Planctomycetota bacterium]HNZ66946.1 cyclic nucleotide-binding domain-containing protein [Planctomycetota bacterium]HON44774.1 cyclic nucleotide-binding domain-containing protein [Planctomycetota bacterium]HPY75618.1 cyclic nucleotide-binding domain-containing protein [Planctomycetota bacterium]HQB01570.1 cyclic nucleotide-binding domain-containing protein [Planctomycetota bacterium]
MKKILYLFSKFIEQDIDWFLSVGVKKNTQEGSILLLENREIAHLYITISGSYAVVKNDRILSKIGAGEVFGEMGLVDPQPMMYTIVSLEEGVVLELNLQQMKMKLKSDTAFASRFYQSICFLLSHKMKEMFQTMTQNEEQFMYEEELSSDNLDEAEVAASHFHKIRTALLS